MAEAKAVVPKVGEQKIEATKDNGEKRAPRKRSSHIRRGRIVPDISNPDCQARILKAYNDARTRPRRIDWPVDEDGIYKFSFTHTPTDDCAKNRSRSLDVFDNTVHDEKWIKEQQNLRRRKDYSSLLEDFSATEAKMAGKSTKGKAAAAAEKENVSFLPNDSTDQYSDSFIKKQQALRRRKNYVSLTSPDEFKTDFANDLEAEHPRRRPTDARFGDYSGVLQGAVNSSSAEASKVSTLGNSKAGASNKSLANFANDGCEMSPISGGRLKHAGRPAPLLAAADEDLSEDVRSIVGLASAQRDWKNIVTSTPLSATLSTPGFNEGPVDKAPARVIKSPSNETIRDDEEVAHTLLTPKATLLQESVLSIKTIHDDEEAHNSNLTLIGSTVSELTLTKEEIKAEPQLPRRSQRQRKPNHVCHLPECQ